MESVCKPKPIRRLQITSSHLIPSLERPLSNLEISSTSVSNSNNIVSIPTHILEFVATRKQQIIEDLDEAKELLSDYTLYSNATEAKLSKQFKNTSVLFSNMFIFSDPPKHTPIRSDIRQILNLMITSKETEKMINILVDELLTNIEKKNGTCFEFVEEFGLNLPLKVVGYILGIDLFHPDNWTYFLKWIEVLSSFLFQFDPLSFKIGVLQQEDNAKEVIEWIKDIIHRRKYSSHGLIHQFIELNKGNVNEDDLIGLISLITFAGHDTTSALLGNLMFIFASFPHVYQELRQNLSLIENSIEETLRLLPPFSLLRKFVLKDYHLQSGRALKRGLVYLNICAMNRSQKYFNNPNSFDLHRPPHQMKTLTFGHGIHMCVGRELAKLEARIALRHILSRVQHISFCSPSQQPQNADIKNSSQEHKWRFSPSQVGSEKLYIKMKFL